jgi:hypothetical protein
MRCSLLLPDGTSNLAGTASGLGVLTTHLQANGWCRLRQLKKF